MGRTWYQRLQSVVVLVACGQCALASSVLGSSPC